MDDPAAEPLSLLDWLKTIEPWPEEFPEIDDPPPEPVDLDLDDDEESPEGASR
jgi:hypothetical protein